MATNACLEASAPHTSQARRSEIERQLRADCALDSYGMLRLWSIFSGSALNV